MINKEDIEKIKIQLGRAPRGVKEIVCYNKEKWPRVVRVTPFVEGKPFPSHYWLTCQILKKRIDNIEAIGWAKKIENEYIAVDEEFRASVHQDHKNYIKDRLEFIAIDELGDKIGEEYISALENRGVGGIADFDRVRCLHMHYAHHLAKSNTIGKLLDELFQLNEL